jgi:hypothetical protein
MSIKIGPNWLTVRWGIQWLKSQKRFHTPWFTLYIER